MLVRGRQEGRNSAAGPSLSLCFFLLPSNNRINKKLNFLLKTPQKSVGYYSK